MCEVHTGYVTRLPTHITEPESKSLITSRALPLHVYRWVLLTTTILCMQAVGKIGMRPKAYNCSVRVFRKCVLTILVWLLCYS